MCSSDLDFSSWLDHVFQGPAHMYPSQDIPASSVILRILQRKLRKDQLDDLMELLSLALEVSESLSLLLCFHSSPFSLTSSSAS